ncbi:hypothetical protein [Massilia glaciei]|uniref:hypothetical protein n=1 Tax=Massilia glaciei TaxID=1524097 RepID=UPI0015E82403|nr:hypothetical protein [Massilia glaciei]
MKTLFLLLALVPTLALSEGVPTTGRVPVPENHSLVHEFLGADGIYTEIFANIFVKDKYVGANVVIRTNDGVSAKNERSLFSLASTTPCEVESGLLRNYVGNKAPSEHNWTRVVPQSWGDSRRRYAPTDNMKDVLATEMCLQTHPPFANYLHSAWSEKIQKILEESAEKDDAYRKAFQETKEKCLSSLERLRTASEQLDAETANLDSRSLSITEYGPSLDFRRQMLETGPKIRELENLTNQLTAKWYADRNNYNLRVRALKADRGSLHKRRERHTERVDTHNDECDKFPGAE